jgi:hypothetical protein
MDNVTQIETRYPLDPKDLQVLYSNHVNIRYLPEEVYLDFCDVQTQMAEPADVDEGGLLRRVPAIARIRVVLSREHAGRLAEILRGSLQEIKEKETKR